MMVPRKPHIEFHGPAAIHDQACAVLPDQSAVFEFSDGLFHPSWKAQHMGYHLVYAGTPFKRWLLRTFFGARAT